MDLDAYVYSHWIRLRSFCYEQVIPVLTDLDNNCKFEMNVSSKTGFQTQMREKKTNYNGASTIIERTLTRHL